jgi:hypothetical protein
MGEKRRSPKRGSTFFTAAALAVGLFLAAGGCRTAPMASATVPELHVDPPAADLSLDGEVRVLEESVESTDIVPDVEPPTLPK